MGGRQTTHVANAYSEDIWVKMEADRAYVELREFNASISGSVKGIGVSGSGGMTTQYNWQYAKTNGFTKIAPRNVLGFNPDADDRGTVYITIVTNSGVVVCECFPKDADYSVIVDKSAGLRSTLHGKLWVDEQGNRH